jgi:hypothetical protein
MNKYEYNTQNWSYIKEELLKVDNILTKEVDVYLIGGSALSFYKIKDSTKDIDALFENQYDCAEFFNSIIKLGYETSEQYYPPVIQMEATFFVYKDDEIWIDLFVKNVMNKFELTNSIKKRSIKTDLPTKKLNVSCLDKNDIFMFKSVTPRERDEDDLVLLLSKSEIDFKTIHEEINNQSAKHKELKDDFNNKMKKLEEKGYHVEYVK